jgi:putative membrane protein
MMWTNGTSWWMWLLIVAGTIGFWVVVAMTVKAVIDPHQPPAPAAPEPARLLDERLARGEIDTDEYLQQRRLITQGH